MTSSKPPHSTAAPRLVPRVHSLSRVSGEWTLSMSQGAVTQQFAQKKQRNKIFNFETTTKIDFLCLSVSIKQNLVCNTRPENVL